MLKQTSIPDHELDSYTERLINLFYTRMGTGSVETLEVPGQEPTTKHSMVKDHLLPKDASFITHTPYSHEIGDDLSCVGEDFEDLNYKASVEAVKLMTDQGLLTRPNTELVVVDVLRAGPLYKIPEALRTVLPQRKFHRVLIRPRYKHVSYRAHDGGEERVVEIIYENCDNIPRNSILTLIFPDSIAGAGTIKVVFPRLLDVAINEHGNAIENSIFYGWMSKRGAVALTKTIESEEKGRNLELESALFTLEDYSDMSINDYDMPLFGLDPALIEKGVKKLCGYLTIVDRDVLKRHILTYTPGNDQLGDYSERGTVLHTTVDQIETPNVIKHLMNSIKMTRGLYVASQGEPWYMPFQNRIFEVHLTSLGRQFGRKIVRDPEFIKTGSYYQDLINIKSLVTKRANGNGVTSPDLISKLERYGALGVCESYTRKGHELDASYDAWSSDNKI